MLSDLEELQSRSTRQKIERLGPELCIVSKKFRNRFLKFVFKILPLR